MRHLLRVLARAGVRARRWRLRACARGLALARSRYNLGLVLDDRGALGAAAEAYERAVELDPGWLEARHNLAVARAELLQQRGGGEGPTGPAGPSGGAGAGPEARGGGAAPPWGLASSAGPGGAATALVLPERRLSAPRAAVAAVAAAAGGPTVDSPPFEVQVRGLAATRLSYSPSFDDSELAYFPGGPAAGGWGDAAYPDQHQLQLQQLQHQHLQQPRRRSASPSVASTMAPETDSDEDEEGSDGRGDGWAAGALPLLPEVRGCSPPPP